MRYLVGFVVALALVASPSSVSADAVEEPAPGEPALELKLDSAGVKLTPTREGFYIVEPEPTERERRPEFRVKPLEPARIGILSSTVVFFLGGIIGSLAFIPGEGLVAAALAWGGAALVSAGLLGMLVSGVVWGVRKRKLRRLQEELYGTPRHAQWSLARSRLVF